MARSKSITCSCEICGKAFFFHYGGKNRYCSFECRIADREDRFWSKVRKTQTCWVWTACISGNNNYGSFKFEGRMQPSHRVAWVLKHGPIPDGLNVLHRCDNPPCVNPDHLFLGTHAENMADMRTKQRQVAPHGSAHGMSKLVEADVIAIRNDTRTHREIAADFGVDPTLIGHVKSGRIWTHVKT